MTVLGIILSFVPLVTTILGFLFFGDMMGGIWRELSNGSPIMGFFLVIPALPYIFFSIKRYRDYSDIRPIKSHLVKYLLSGIGIFFVAGFFSPILLPILEIVCQFKLSRLEQELYWEEDEDHYDGKVVDYYSDRVGLRQDSHALPKFSKKGIFLSVRPLTAALISISLIRLVPSGVPVGIALILFYIPAIISYITYIYRRKRNYQSQPEIYELLEKLYKIILSLIGLAQMSLSLIYAIYLFPPSQYIIFILQALVPILLPILEIICYIRVRHMEERY